MSAPKPELLLATAFIRENFEPSDRLAVVALNKRTHSVTQRVAPAEAIVGADFQSWLFSKNERDRCEIYISMNALRPDARGRTKEEVEAIRHVYLDFDVDGTAAIERLLTRTDVPKPNYVVSSSPDKWQVIWKVASFAKDEAEQLQRGLARDTSADIAATDCARVLRLPGFWNHKYAQPYLVQARSLSRETYRLDQFPWLVPADRHDSMGARRPPHLRPRGALSQSERDWAYAKRALARGESPAQVIAAIANHRRFDKSGPERYAELTVRKAQEALKLGMNREDALERG